MQNEDLTIKNHAKLGFKPSKTMQNEDLTTKNHAEL